MHRVILPTQGYTPTHKPKERNIMLNNLLNKFTEVITNVKLNMFISGGLCTAGILKLQTGNYLIALINLTLGVATLCAYWGEGDCTEGGERE